MGELDGNPFLAAMKKKYRGKEALEKATIECSQWEDHIRDPNWHPFKILIDEAGNATVCVNIDIIVLLIPSFYLIFIWPFQHKLISGVNITDNLSE